MSDSSTRTPDAMPIMEHLRELRSRIIRSFLAIAVASLTMLTVYDPVKNFLTQPYRNLCSSRPDFKCDGSLFSLGPLDGFSARMRICLYGGVVLALPVILWQIWRFIVPALSKKKNVMQCRSSSRRLCCSQSVVRLHIGHSIRLWSFLSRGPVLTFLRRTK